MIGDDTQQSQWVEVCMDPSCSDYGMRAASPPDRREVLTDLANQDAGHKARRKARRKAAAKARRRSR